MKREGTYCDDRLVHGLKGKHPCDPTCMQVLVRVAIGLRVNALPDLCSIIQSRAFLLSSERILGISLEDPSQSIE